MSNLPDWTKLSASEKTDAVLPLLAAGETNRAIAALFLNCGSSQISGLVSRMKTAGMNPPARRVSWPKPKKTAKPAKPAAPKPTTPKRTARTAEVVSWRGPNNPHHNDVKARAEQRAASPGIEVKRENAFDPLPGIEPVAFGSPGCRWPVDGLKGKGLLACGAAKVGANYCNAHQRLAHEPPSVRQRASLRSAERIL